MTCSTVEQIHDMYDVVSYEVSMPDGSLYNLLDDTARLYPDRIVLDYFRATTTYAQVRDQVLKTARVLHEAGIRPGDTVAIALPNCPQAFVAFYAYIRIGTIAAQHNPLAPAPKIAGQLGHHGGKMAIMQERCVNAYPPGVLDTVFTMGVSHDVPASQRLFLRPLVARAYEARNQLRDSVPSDTRSRDHVTASSAPIDPSFSLPSPDDRAVVLHMSGTNGILRSAPLTRRNTGVSVNQCMFWVWELHEGAETFFSLLPYFRVFGLTFFLCASVREAAIQVLLPKFDAQMALDTHKRRPITFFVGVSPTFERILRLATRTKTDLSFIRYSIAGAMPLPTTLAGEWEKATGGMIIEDYGLSETAPVLTGALLSDKRRHGVLRVLFPSTQLRLVSLDDDTLDVEDNQPGKVIARGPQIFEEYLDTAEEIARVSTPGGWFRMGDIGVNSDGFISMTDRKKEFILSGGSSVYPSQVEAAIRSHPSVSGVIIVDIPVPDVTEEVAAAIIMQEGSAPLILEEVRAWTEKTIARYALPHQFVVITEFPHDQMGKILRHKVAQLICEVLGRQFSYYRRAPPQHRVKQSPGM